MFNKELVAYLPRPEDDFESFNRLFVGLGSEEDPVSWRTAVITVRELLMSGDEEINADLSAPDYDLERGFEFVSELLEETWLKSLTPEFFMAVFDLEEMPELVTPLLDCMVNDLDAVLMNARHLPEELLFRLGEEFGSKEGVVIVNPIGHYADKQTRVIGPHIKRKIGNLVFLASTQNSKGGHLSVLLDALGLLEDKELVSRAENVSVVIPMFGGSRSHRPGQGESLGFEVLQAKTSARAIKGLLSDLAQEYSKDGIEMPEINVYSVDIHNGEWPAGVFDGDGLTFESISPSPVFAPAVFEYVKDNDLSEYPIQLVASDKGAAERTREIAEEMLDLLEGGAEIDLVYFDKSRVTAGVVGETQLSRIEKWRKVDGEIKIVVVGSEDYDWETRRVCVMSDDMVDTGGTQERGVRRTRDLNPNVEAVVVVATHPVTSQGVEMLDRVPADVIIVANTLTNGDRPDMRKANIAPVIHKAIVA